jgi:hypothetical protein
MTHTWVSALGAVTLVASLALATPSPAAEPRLADDAMPISRMAAAAPTPLKALGPPRRSVYSKVVWRDGHLSLRGNVEDYPSRVVLVQRKACGGCSWRGFDLARTGKSSWFRSTISAPAIGSTWWRARVAASDGYATSYSATWETYY